MIDFDRWFNRQAAMSEEVGELPESIVQIKMDGKIKYMAICCCCDQVTELPVDLSEIPQTGYQHYCGGSPRCCP